MADKETGGADALNMDSLISQATSNDVRQGGNDALDNLVIRISGPADDDGESSSGSNSGGPAEQPRRRGRPPGSGTRSTGQGKSTRKSKAEVESELASVKAELEAERARNNAQAVGELAQQVEMCVFLVFGAFASKRGPHWSMTPKEAENIGKTGAMALAPHADTLRKYSPWGMFAATLGGAFFTRIQEDRRLVELHGVQTKED
jgi:hypothetical protein